MRLQEPKNPTALVRAFQMILSQIPRWIAFRMTKARVISIENWNGLGKLGLNGEIVMGSNLALMFCKSIVMQSHTRYCWRVRLSASSGLNGVWAPCLMSSFERTRLSVKRREPLCTNLLFALRFHCVLFLFATAPSLSLSLSAPFAFSTGLPSPLSWLAMHWPNDVA